MVLSSNTITGWRSSIGRIANLPITSAWIACERLSKGMTVTGVYIRQACPLKHMCPSPSGEKGLKIRNQGYCI